MPQTDADSVPQSDPTIAQEQPVQKDKRNAPRLDLERPVQIVGLNTSPIVCTLSDVSKSGARLAVADPSAVPDEFEIQFKDDLRKWCRVMRRSEKHIGIKFVHRPQPSPPVVPSDTPAQPA
jgi:hypothetical protein